MHKKIGLLVSLILGVTLLAFFYNHINLKLWMWVLLPFVVLFFSNLPDLDHHMGKLRKKVLAIIFSIMVLSVITTYFIHIGLMLVLLCITGFLGLGLLKVKHRGPLHTYWFVTLVSLPTLLINWFFFVIAIVCSFSHIFVDRTFSNTKRKVKKLFGISGERRDYYIHLKW